MVKVSIISVRGMSYDEEESLINDTLIKLQKENNCKIKEVIPRSNSVVIIYDEETSKRKYTRRSSKDKVQTPLSFNYQIVSQDAASLNDISFTYPTPTIDVEEN